MMNVLHLSNTPLSNAPANLAQAQKDSELMDTLLLVDRKSNINKVHVGGTEWKEFDTEILHSIFNRVDIIHFHNFAQEQNIFRVHPELWDIAKKKKCVIQYHSPRNSTENFEHTIKDPMFNGRKMVLAQYHTRQYVECEHIVPNVIPIFDQKYMPLPAKHQEVNTVVSFAPSNVNLRGWDYKGYDVLVPILREIGKLPKVTIDVIKNTPYEDCMAKKRWAHIGIEELVTGSYHLSFLEYMSMGCATFAYMDDLTKEAIGHIVGEHGVQRFAHIQVTPDRLYKKLHAMIAMGAAEGIGNDCRTWMEKYWHPTDHAKRFYKIYSSL